MKQSKIDFFFSELDHEFRKPSEVIITGAACAALMGYVRPSADIDFEIRLKKSSHSVQDKALLERAVEQSSKKTALATNYSEDISHWSMINYLDYRKKAKSYKTFGHLRVKLMAPEHWTIGKMGRFLELDILDMRKVIQKMRLQPDALIKTWARAFRLSPLSLAKGQFRDHVLYFLRNYGKAVWGKNYDSNLAVQNFYRYAKILLNYTN